jgi:FKBP-type peptidyl-prolyl cis-trans isomerase
MKKVRGLLGIALIVVLLFNMTSCLDSNVEDPNKQLNADIAAIDAFLASNIFANIVKDPYGIRMEILELGTGLPAKGLATTVDVDYVGKLFSTGATFAPSANTRLPLSNFIDGWKVAFTTLPAGSRAKLYIPSPLGYGSQARTGIPANSILVFEVEFNEAVVTSAELTKLASDTVAIDNYLTGKSINAIKDTTGIRYVITQPGTGPTATLYNRLKLKLSYKLLTDDTKVVASVEQTPSEYFYSRAVDYIHGLKIALPKLSEGGKATLYIPSGLGFGTTDARDGTGAVVIPANSNIIIDVEVTDIAAQ